MQPGTTRVVLGIGRRVRRPEQSLSHAILVNLRNVEASGPKREVIIELARAGSDADLAKEICYPRRNKQGDNKKRQAGGDTFADHAAILAGSAQSSQFCPRRSDRAY